MVKVEHFLLDGKLCSDLHSADSTVLKGRQAGMGYRRPGAHRGPHHSQGRRISTDWLLVGQSASGEVVEFKGWPKLQWFVTERLPKPPKEWLPPPRLTGLVTNTILFC